MLPGDGTQLPAGLLDNVRALRGTAHIAREDAVLRAVRPLEAALKTIARGELAWTTDVQTAVAAAVADLEEIVGKPPDGPVDDDRIAQAIARWREFGVEIVEVAAEEEALAAEPEHAADFTTFAVAEISGIAEVLETALRAFSDNPMDREALKVVLRRQRALLGAARLDEIPVAADTLRAVEDISRIIAKMNVAIKDEWLDVFRCARQVLETASAALSNGESPPHVPALSRLRTYREELLERYGAGEELSPDASPAEGLVQAVAANPVIPMAPGTSGAAPARATGRSPAESAERADATADREAAPVANPLDIQDLIYTGDAALRRALELRARLERAVEDDPDALALVDEVFDLIRLALK